MKIIKHSWNKYAPFEYQCKNCKCFKMVEDRGNGFKYHFYDRYGRELINLPECKTIFHNDKI